MVLDHPGHGLGVVALPGQAVEARDVGFEFAPVPTLLPGGFRLVHLAIREGVGKVPEGLSLLGREAWGMLDHLFRALTARRAERKAGEEARKKLEASAKIPWEFRFAPDFGTPGWEKLSEDEKAKITAWRQQQARTTQEPNRSGPTPQNPPEA